MFIARCLYILWSFTLWLPRMAWTASFKACSLSWRSLNSFSPNLLSKGNANTRCSTDRNESPISFLYFRAFSKREVKCEPTIGPEVSPETCQKFSRNTFELWIFLEKQLWDSKWMKLIWCIPLVGEIWSYQLTAAAMCCQAQPWWIFF